MDITLEHFDEHSLLEARIRVTALGSEVQLGLVLDTYDAALDKIAGKMVAGDSHYVGITLSMRGASSRSSARALPCAPLD